MKKTALLILVSLFSLTIFGQNITGQWNGVLKVQGDTIIVYEYSTNNSKNIQTIWTNLDSTKVFIRDIFD
ncbi:MAG: hypothetical protein H7331_08735 [Bacteroidia bacterium]|nr:hypothetical protein [Bacteroidia bacterium]